MKLPFLFHRAKIIVFGKLNAELERRFLYIVFTVSAVGMLLYSQTLAFHWDEGFHILAANLINAGKQPYLDFFFAQTPLNAYWNAGWMKLFGSDWRVVHLVAAMASLGAVFLIIQYLFSLFADHRWQTAAALTALALFGLQLLVWDFGTIAQAYPLCLLLLVASFRTALVAVTRLRPAMSALAGLLAGTAAASSLLTAPASVVLLIWIWLYNREGNRWVKTAAFVGGGITACIPVLALFLQGPYQVIFCILKYHSIYRRVNWEGATSHDIGVLTGWVNSSPSLMLVLLAAAGLFSIHRSEVDLRRRAEFRLCLWLVFAIGVQNVFARPTFPQYFIFLIPFLTILGVMGFHATAIRLVDPGRPSRPALVLLGITILCFGSGVYEGRDSYSWRQLEKVATKVKEVTPKFAPLLAPEQIYFLTRWPIPTGLEYADLTKLQLSQDQNALLHILPKAELDRQLKLGVFPTSVVCDDEPRVGEIEEWELYSQKADFGECTVFWQLDTKTLHPDSQY